MTGNGQPRVKAKHEAHSNPARTSDAVASLDHIVELRLSRGLLDVRHRPVVQRLMSLLCALHHVLQHLAIRGGARRLAYALQKHSHEAEDTCLRLSQRWGELVIFHVQVECKLFRRVAE